MNIILYRISDPPNVVNKVLHDKNEIEDVRFTEERYLDVVNPTVQLHSVSYDSITDYSKYNYMYIPKFARYYYIDEITTVNAIVEIKCRCDVLRSFKSDIIGSKQYISRSQTSNNKYMVDHLLPMQSKHHFKIHTFGDPVFDEGCYHVILETTGKGGYIDG